MHVVEKKPLVVKFNPTSKLAEDTVPPPKPARTYFPEWYKSLPAFENNKITFTDTGDVNKGLKMCVPFSDSLGLGYIQETWQDINIEKIIFENFELDLPKFYYPTEPKIMSLREKVAVPLPEEYYPAEFVFHPPWSPELPKGWSMFYCQPTNRLDLPFQFLSGVIDSDSFTQAEPRSNIPFYIKKSFTGIIPKGTPFLQMIPVKRESWKSEIQEYNESKRVAITSKNVQRFWGGYKKEYWTKKEYR